MSIDQPDIIAGLQNKVMCLEKELKDVKDAHFQQMMSVQRRLDALEKKDTSDENRSRRKNLIFYNVPEVKSENWDACRDTVKDLVKSAGMELSEYGVERAHRIGKFSKKASRPRPMIALFSHWEEKESVLNLGKKINDSCNVSVAQDFAPATRKARSVLYKRMKEERSLGRRATLVMDTLHVGQRGDRNSFSLIYNHEKDEVQFVNSDRSALTQSSSLAASPATGANNSALGQRRQNQPATSLLDPERKSVPALEPRPLFGSPLPSTSAEPTSVNSAFELPSSGQALPSNLATPSKFTEAQNKDRIGTPGKRTVSEAELSPIAQNLPKKTTSMKNGTLDSYFATTKQKSSPASSLEESYHSPQVTRSPSFINPALQEVDLTPSQSPSQGKKDHA